jgi:hypothetical protein
MITLTPNSTPIDVSHVLEILTLASDPVATKARLTELQEATDQSNFAAGTAKSLQSDATQRMAVYQASAANLTKDKDAFARLTKEVSDRQSSTDAALVARKVDLDAREAALTASMESREKAVTQREADVSVRQAALLADGDKAATLKAEYEDMIAGIRKITGEK